MAESRLLVALWGRQHELGWSDTRLAQELGLTGGAISLLKHGKRTPSASTTQAILRRFPELLGYLLPLPAGDGGETVESGGRGSQLATPRA